MWNHTRRPRRCSCTRRVLNGSNARPMAPSCADPLDTPSARGGNKAGCARYAYTCHTTPVHSKSHGDTKSTLQGIGGKETRCNHVSAHVMRGHPQDPRSLHSHQPSEWDQTVLFEPPHLCHKTLDSSRLQYKSKGLRRAMLSHCQGWWSRKLSGGSVRKEFQFNTV